MKKIIPLVIGASFLFATPAWANPYKARCLDAQDSLTRCQVNLEGETLSITYNLEEHQGLNLTLPVNRITSVSSQAYRGRRDFCRTYATVTSDGAAAPH